MTHSSFALARLALVVGLARRGLPGCEDEAVQDGNAQIAVIRRRLGERVKSTLSGP